MGQGFPTRFPLRTQVFLVRCGGMPPLWFLLYPTQTGLSPYAWRYSSVSIVPPVAGRGPAGPAMEPSGGRKERPKGREPAARLEKAKQRAAQQELKQRQRAEIYALNRVMTELEQRQFDAFCKQMQAGGE